MIESLNELLAAPLLAEELPGVAAAAKAEGAEVLRSSIWLVAGTTLVTFCAMLAALLVYRVLVARITPSDSHRA